MAKIGVLSNVNMEPIKSHFESVDWGDHYFCAFGQYMQEFMDPKSTINQTDINMVILHLDGEEFLKENYFHLPEQEKIYGSFEILINVIDKWSEANPQKILLISNLVFPPLSVINYMDKNTTCSFSEIEVNLERRLIESAQKNANVYIADFHRLMKRYGYENICNEKYWYLGRIKYTDLGFQLISQEWFNVIKAVQGKAKKVLVCDLDNVLWGGIAGEDGPSGVDLSEDGTGKTYRDLQKTIKSLKEQGVVLAINSKNNDQDVQDVFKQNQMMVLQYDDFVIKKVNWQNKINNLQEIAAELNVGLDAIVMIDDSPQERHFIQQALPEVTVPEFPTDMALLKRWFIEDVIYPYFGRVALTREDQDKAEQYARNIKRDVLATEMDLSAYIASLDINIKVHKNSLEHLDRLTQLVQKTNQFNLTTQRYQKSEILTFIEDETADVYGLSYRDRFGEEGLIGVCIIKYFSERTVIDTFLLSCRILGRNVEYEFLNEILKDLLERHVSEVCAEYIRTPKNGQAESFYEKCGFESIDEHRYKASVEALVSTQMKITE